MKKEKKFLSQICYTKIMKACLIFDKRKPLKITKQQRKVRFNTKAKTERILHNIFYMKIIKSIGPFELHSVG